MPEYQFRVNGVIVSEIRVQRKLVNGEPVGELQIAVRDTTIGWFVIDDNANLWDGSLPKFVLEYRDESAWTLIPAIERSRIRGKGWKQVTPQELIAILESTGAIQ